MSESKKALAAILVGGIFLIGATRRATDYLTKQACQEYAAADIIDKSRGVQERYAHEKFTEAKKGLFGVSERVRSSFVKAELDQMSQCGKKYKEK